MANRIYSQLREKIDTYSFGFPATSSGVEIELLQKLFTPDEAEVGVNLGMKPEPVEVIAARMNRDPKELAGVLAGMVRKGTVFNSVSRQGETRYHGAPYMHGLAENSAGNMDPELAKLFERYQEESDGFLQYFGALPLQSFVRFVPVGEALDSELNVAPYNQIEELLKSKKTIAAIPCYCRDHKKVLGGNCQLSSKDACFVFDWLADYSVERGQARYLSLEEALETQRGFEEAGLVNMPSNVESALALCHCCGDCCTIFRAIKTHPKPAEAVVSDFYAEVGQNECNACEACIEYCPMDAISNDDIADGTVAINLDRCIGCGVCISRCSVEALKLREKPEDLKKRKPLHAKEFLADLSQHRQINASSIPKG
ncbi:MAG: 4Fe-4S binding protein [Georgfuchsia sp.]